MDKLILKIAIARVLKDQNKYVLYTLLERQTDTIYRLATLKNKMRKNPSVVGVCAEIDNCLLVEALSPAWKHFSGCTIYPIPGHNKNQDPERAYFEIYKRQDKWMGQQKHYRFSLIDHLLKNAPTFYQAIEKRLKQ